MYIVDLYKSFTVGAVFTSTTTRNDQISCCKFSPSVDTMRYTIRYDKESLRPRTHALASVYAH